MLKVLQINLRKSRQALDHLISQLAKDPFTVALCQEIYYYKGRAPIPKGYILYGTENSRAAIIAPSSLPIFINHELSTNDCTVCSLDIDNGKSQIFLASIYLDILLNCITPAMNSLCEYVQDRDIKTVLSIDSNAHSSCWFSEDSNSRGEQLEEFIMQQNLDIMNIGNKPTFINSRSSTIIDITLTYNAKDIIYDWYVRPDYFFSDHRCVQFKIFTGKIQLPTVAKIDWPKFVSSLEIEECEYNLWTVDTIETEASALLGIINAAIAANTTESTLRPNSLSWWNNTLQKSKIKVINLNSQMRAHSQCALLKNEYISAKKDFQKLCRKSKRESWREYCNKINSPKSMSILNKALNRNKPINIGLMKTPGGQFSNSPQESVDLLLNTHFRKSVPLNVADINTLNCTKANFSITEIPQITGKIFSSNQIANYKATMYAVFCSKKDLDFSFITEKSVYHAINSFGADKIGGPDNLKPKALQYFIQNEIALKRLTRLYQAIIELGHTPKKWCASKVIFLPKPNKMDYSDAKSYRPISLMSFLLKTLEKLVLWEIETTSLKENPISKNQHAFRKGYSCDTALSDLVDDIESNILRNKMALSVFLDIAAAFDCVSYESAIKAMNDFKVSKKIVKWYKSFLDNRTAFTNQNGIESYIKVNCGTAQGGVLSSLIWNMVFESFIKLFENSAIHTRCFADDACLTITGIDCNTMIDQMQESITKAVQWGTTYGLNFVPQKTNAIFFHRKKKLEEQKKLKINNVQIEYQNQVKYLGVYLDSKLTWKFHVTQKIAKAKQLIMKIKGAIGTLWGPSPKILRWAYNGIVLPSLTFGSAIWSRVCKDGSVQNKLSKLNRLIALCMMPLRRGTPSAALQVILDLPPVDLIIKQKALCSMLRILTHDRSKWDGHGEKGKGHLKYGQIELQKIGINNKTFDDTNILSIHKNYVTNLSSFKSGVPDAISDIQCYTDGSKLEGKTGYGLGIFKGDTVIADDNGCISENTSVFQSEILAIHKACELLYGCNAKNVTIFSDSQAAIAALAGTKVKYKTVENCIKHLNILGQETNVEIKWVKGHCDFSGNEYVDMLAKLGTKNTQKIINVPPPISWAKLLINQEIYKIWRQRWCYIEGQRQSKIWFPTLYKKASKQLLELSRNELGLCVQMLTGHNRLNRHESLINPGISPMCRLCTEEEETSWHIIGECPMLRSKRWQSFGEPYLDNPPEWRPWKLLQFLHDAKIAEMNKREILNPSQSQ